MRVRVRIRVRVRVGARVRVQAWRVRGGSARAARRARRAGWESPHGRGGRLR